MGKIKYLFAAAGISALLMTYAMPSMAQKPIVDSNIYAEFNDIVKHPKTLLQLDNIIANNENVVVDFSAPSVCKYCKWYGPIFNEVAEEYNDVVFCEVLLDEISKISLDDMVEIMSAYTVRPIPDTRFFKYGEEVHKYLGFMKKKGLSNLIDKYLLEK